MGGYSRSEPDRKDGMTGERDPEREHKVERVREEQQRETKRIEREEEREDLAEEDDRSSEDEQTPD